MCLRIDHATMSTSETNTCVPNFASSDDDLALSYDDYSFDWPRTRSGVRAARAVSSHAVRLFGHDCSDFTIQCNHVQFGLLDSRSLHYYCNCDDYDIHEVHFSAYLPSTNFNAIHSHCDRYREHHPWEFPGEASLHHERCSIEQFNSEIWPRNECFSLFDRTLASIFSPCLAAFNSAASTLSYHYVCGGTIEDNSGDRESHKLVKSLEHFQYRFTGAHDICYYIFTNSQIYLPRTFRNDRYDPIDDRALDDLKYLFTHGIEREMFQAFRNVGTTADNLASITNTLKSACDIIQANFGDVPNVPKDIAYGYSRQHDNGISYQNPLTPNPGHTAVSAMSTNIGRLAHDILNDAVPAVFNAASDADEAAKFYAMLIRCVEYLSYMPIPIFVSHTIHEILQYIGLPDGFISLVCICISNVVVSLGIPSEPIKMGGVSGINREIDISFLTSFAKDFGPSIKNLISSAAKMAREVTAVIKFIELVSGFGKAILDWLFPSQIEDAQLQEDLEIFLCVVKHYTDEAFHHQISNINHRELILEQKDRYFRLVKHFANLTRRNPNNQSFVQFHSAAAQYELLCSAVQHHGALGSVTARPEPHVCVFTGDSNIGKSTLQSYLQGVVVDEVKDYMTSHETLNLVCTLNLALPHYDNYTGQFIVCLDDLFTTAESTACSGAAKFNAMVSNADYVVPMAKLEQKGHKFTSRVILASTNNPYPRLPDVTYHDCIWRRRDLLVLVKTNGVARKPLDDDPLDATNFRHLKFRLMNPLKDNEFISDWMDYAEFERRYRTSLSSKFEHQTIIVKKLQEHMSNNSPPTPPKEELLKEIVFEAKEHYYFDNFKVYCKDVACTCLGAFTDAERFIYQTFNTTTEVLSDIMTTTLDSIKSYVSNILDIAQPTFRFLLKLGGIAGGLALAYKMWKAFGKPEAITRELDVEIEDWRSKNANHFKNKPKQASKAEWRQLLVTDEVSKLNDSDEYCYKIKKCDGERLILERGDRITKNVIIKSSQQGLLEKPSMIENPYKLAETPQAISIPISKRIELESQNSEEALNIIKKHTYVISLTTPQHSLTMHATHVMAQFILVPYHFFELLSPGDVFELYPYNGSARRTIWYHPRHCLRIKDSDVCVYWVAGDMCSSSVLRQFLTLKQLESINYVKQLECFAFSKTDGWQRNCHVDARVDEYAENFSDTGMFIDKQSMSFKGSPASGRCGALYVATEGAHPGVLGFHIGFREGDRRSMLRLISRDEIEILVNKLADRLSIPVGIAPPVPSFIREGDGESIGANMPFVGYISPELARFQPKNHAKTPSPAYGLLYDVRKGNSVLSKNDKRILEEYRGEMNILESGLMKYSVPYTEYPWELIPKFEEFHYMRFKQFKTSVKPCIREYDEVINGIRREDDSFVSFFRGLNMKSSPGFGWKTTQNEPGKLGLFYAQPTSYGFHYTMKPELQKAVDDLEQELLKGNLPHAITVNCLKSELRTLSKIETGNTRNFVVFPVEWTIVASKYFKDWSVAMAETHGDSTAQIGIDPTGLDWHHMVKDLLRYSTVNGFDGDYKAYDGAVFYQQAIPIVNAINRWYDDGPDNARVRHLLTVRMFYSYILSGNRVHYKNQGQTSGNILTSPLNCEVNAQLFAFAFLMSWYEECRANPKNNISDYGLHNMEDFVCSKFYGDDNIHAVKEEIKHWFYPERIAKHINSTGFHITDAAKTGVLEWKPVTDLTFLKMNIAKLNGIYVGQLDKVSIEEMANWVRDNSLATPEEKMRDNFDTMLRFAFAHGREYHDEMLGKVNDFLACRDLDIIKTTYNDRYLTFIDKKVGAQFGEYTGDIPRILTSLYNQNSFDWDSDTSSDYHSVVG